VGHIFKLKPLKKKSKRVGEGEKEGRKRVIGDKSRYFTVSSKQLTTFVHRKDTKNIVWYKIDTQGGYFCAE
jgi:hypothetical protein